MTATTPNLLNNVITIDDERVKNQLDRVVGGRGGGIERAVGGRGRLAVQCAALRTHRGTSGHARRPLRAQQQTKAGEVAAEGAETSRADVLDGDHRAFPTARELGR